MNRRTGRATPRLVVAGALGLAVLMSSHASAVPSTSPTLEVTSKVAGQASPVAFSSGEWTYTEGVWTLPLRSWSLPGGSTTVTATWRSPVFRPARSEAVFVADVEVLHQGVAGNEAVEHWFRVCESRTRCTRWDGIGSDDVPDNVDPETIPYRITSGYDLTQGWRDKPTPIWIEWRYTHTQRDASHAENTIRLAIGAAAARVR